jgi:hypothetical protein
VDAEILVCASCETRWRMELGRLYAVSPAVAKETEPVDTEWGMIATPTVIELDPADPTPARPT